MDYNQIKNQGVEKKKEEFPLLPQVANHLLLGSKIYNLIAEKNYEIRV